jgi:hypothetical protein
VVDDVLKRRVNGLGHRFRPEDLLDALELLAVDC